ncbi:hypothetical protein [Streptomyces sp. KMM 9044]|uniref:hypothetical protein n=1 Tax=Streptomyces sp. KMM 9044 TaxID=2744474 RepID=UPI002150D0F8|nr:hypothetical protein [Streptomyces sp. KMM 9044]WAX77406.1 hypothetical protein HUV60_006760 [Streptomyces sp. KMM 9044]WAX77515.1 hypothetical protein HUV60_007405 [Streptomyces sp. KMM 9044]WAX77801.1 hypothetical protein HUV60_009030 [Streptomyces sp. KMM 9044]WAX78780.1 hypothetical protein HUV60_014905 [Streptomyces sp. KMM 9044]WAX79988.1 hypothetical protein HUV60_022285 [Streptomyces sp. KMM 9044]
MQATEWDRRLVVRADGKNLVGHAGVVLLHRIADRVGLTRALAAALPRGVGPGWRDRGMALVQLACAIVLGARNVLQAEQLQQHWRPFFPVRSRTAPCGARWKPSTALSEPGWSACAP